LKLRKSIRRLVNIRDVVFCRDERFEQQSTRGIAVKFVQKTRSPKGRHKQQETFSTDIWVVFHELITLDNCE